jgi:hypothetical protein
VHLPGVHFYLTGQWQAFIFLAHCDFFFTDSTEYFFLLLSASPSTQLCGHAIVFLPSLGDGSYEMKKETARFFTWVVSKLCPHVAHCYEVLSLERPTHSWFQKQYFLLSMGWRIGRLIALRSEGKREKFSIIVPIRDSFVANWHVVSPLRYIATLLCGTYRFDFAYFITYWPAFFSC